MPCGNVGGKLKPTKVAIKQYLSTSMRKLTTCKFLGLLKSYIEKSWKLPCGNVSKKKQKQESSSSFNEHAEMDNL